MTVNVIPSPLMTTAFVAIIHHKHGEDILIADSDAARAVVVAEWCREWWAEAFGEIRPVAPDSEGRAREIVAQYFRNEPTDDGEWVEYEQLDVKGVQW